MNYNDIGKQIRNERIKQNLTQEQLSEKANISVSHLSGIERGMTKLGIRSFIGIANALKVSSDFLLCYSLENQESKLVISGNIADIIADCSKIELMFIEETVQSTKNSLRRIFTASDN